MYNPIKTSKTKKGTNVFSLHNNKKIIIIMIIMIIKEEI